MKKRESISLSFNKILSHPESAVQEDYDAWVSQFPYCQALRKLPLLNFNLQDSLAKYYESGTFLSAVKPSIPSEQRELIESKLDQEKTGQDSPDSQSTQEEKVSLYHDEHMPYTFLWWLNKTRKEYAHTYRPFAKPDSQIFNDKLFIDQQIKEHILKNEPPLVDLTLSDTSEKNNAEDIIEKFIKEEPKISPPSAEKIDLENKARKSSEDSLVIVSETLAKIYTEQGLYLKAIETYKKLSLKYPEKNVYFAKQIENLNNKIE